jgi:hypothetical protein
MNEPSWLRCADPDAMLHYLRGKPKERQFRLFACACCRRIWHLLPDERSRRALETVERFADGLATRKDLDAARTAAEAVTAHYAARERQVEALAAASAVHSAIDANVARGAGQVADRAAEALSYYAVRQRGWWPDLRTQKKARLTSKHAERANQADLLRDIFGNPFRPAPVMQEWPALSVTLAEAVYRGEDCLFALHDALLESGQGTLADHFREKTHPKGCWALDAILEKKTSLSATAGDNE